MAAPLPSWMSNNRRVIRATPNPMDKSTVVNISQMFLQEHKPTIDPGWFEVPKGTYDKPGILVVGSSSWWREIDESQPMLEITNSSIQVAKSIVDDFCNGLIECNMNDSMPGLFWVPGELSLKELKERHKEEFDKAQTKQQKWYHAVVASADILWARSNQNPLSINDTMRTAARELGYDRPWLQNFLAVTMGNCPACGAIHNPAYPRCGNCNFVIDKVRAKELGIAV